MDTAQLLAVTKLTKYDWRPFSVAVTTAKDEIYDYKKGKKTSFQLPVLRSTLKDESEVS